MKKLFFISSEKGVGLLAAILAAALVVVMALVVSRYIVTQNKTVMTLESSASCQQVLKTAMDYIAKDDNSLNITTIGPAVGSSNYLPNADVTADGLNRYEFNGGAVTAHIRTDAGIPITGLTTTSVSVPVPNSIRFTNFLNKRNSYSRLLTLAANRDVCFDGLEGSGSLIYENGGAQNISGLIINEPGARIYLFVDPRENESSLCASNRLSRLPDPKLRNELRYKIRVTMNENEPTQKGCEASNSVHMGQDTDAPFTLLTLSNATTTAPNTLNPNLCGGGKIGNPSLCSSADTVTLDLMTVTDNAGVDSLSRECAACLRSMRNPTCQESGSNMFNNFTECVNPSSPGNPNPACRMIDPGSLYLCRIGETRWFRTAGQGLHFWQPCHAAQVWRWDPIANTSVAIAGAVVQIQYLRDATQNSLTDRTTRARLTLRGLPQMAYSVDVRAVDTAGALIGPSFCALANNGTGCNTSPTFVVNTAAPALTAPESSGRIVGQTSDRVLGFSQTPPSSAELAPFGNNLYQCQSSSGETFQSMANYTVPNGADSNLGVSGSCSAIYTSGGSGGLSCECDNTATCRVTGGATAAPGNYAFRLDFANECGHNTNVSQNWCYDPTANYTVTTTQNNPVGVSPTFTRTTGGKTCGLSVRCPSVSGSGGYSLNAACANLPDWNLALHAGCLAAPGVKQFCSSGFDPCGRGFESPTAYASLLPLASTGNPHMCQTIQSNLTNGNRCDSGWCNSSAQCQTACGFSGHACSADSECTDSDTCPGQTGSCNGVTWSCQTPTGTFAPVNSASCPSSCLANISCNGISSSVRKCANNLGGPICSVNADCPSSTCVDTGTCGDSAAAVCSNSTQCRYTGTCFVANPSDRGTCACPTNTTCETCPPTGAPRLCPQANACAPSLLPTLGNLSCSSPPTPDPEVWSETSRSNCSATACGTSGTITITETCHRGVTLCGTRTSTIPCSAQACGRWCLVGSDTICNSNIDITASCTPGESGYVNSPGCLMNPRSYQATEWLCVATTTPCPLAPNASGPCDCTHYNSTNCSAATVHGGCRVSCTGGGSVYYRCL